MSPSDSLRAASEKHRSSSDYGLDSKKRKVDDKDSMSRYVSVCVCFFVCGVCVIEFSSFPAVAVGGVLSLFALVFEL